MPEILLLHGLGRTKKSMSVLAWYLEKHNYQTFNFEFNSRGASIGVHVDSLYSYIQQNDLAGKTIDVVAHSLGNIVVRTLLNCHPDIVKINRFVMLGPPNQGSALALKLARFSLFRMIMGPTLDELANLTLDDSICLKAEVGILAGGSGTRFGFMPFVHKGDNDMIVTVNETALTGARQHKIVFGIHALLMVQPKVLREVLHFLQVGKFSS